MKKIKYIFVLSRGRGEDLKKNSETIKEVSSQKSVLMLMIVYSPDSMCTELIKPYLDDSGVYLKPMPKDWMGKIDFDTTPDELTALENEAVENGCTAILFLTGATVSCNLLCILGYMNNCYENVGQFIPMYPTEMMAIIGDTWSKTMKDKAD